MRTLSVNQQAEVLEDGEGVRRGGIECCVVLSASGRVYRFNLIGDRCRNPPLTKAEVLLRR
jgi:hypothetical protein